MRDEGLVILIFPSVMARKWEGVLPPLETAYEYKDIEYFSFYLLYRILNVPQEIDANTTVSFGEGSRDTGNQKWNQYGNNRGGSEDTYAYGDSNPKTVEGYNPSPNARSLNPREKRGSQGPLARSSDPQSNSFGDWPEADESEDRGNNRNRINVAIDK